MADNGKYSLNEINKTLDKVAKELVLLKDSQKETDAKFQETDKEITRITNKLDKVGDFLKEVGSHVDGISKSNGLVAETLISNTLENTLSLNGWQFNNSTTNFKKYIKILNIREQYDMILEKDDLIAVIEIKYRAKAGDIEKLNNNKIPNYKLINPNETRRIVGVLACLSYEEDVIQTAEKFGIYVITLSGEEIKVENPNYKLF